MLNYISDIFIFAIFFIEFPGIVFFKMSFVFKNVKKLKKMTKNNLETVENIEQSEKRKMFPRLVPTF